jgi:hypothetical protein
LEKKLKKFKESQTLKTQPDPGWVSLSARSAFAV